MNLYQIVQRFDACSKTTAEIVSHAISIRHTNPLAFKACSAYTIVRLHDIWATHCRQLVLYSCRKGVSTLSGQTLPRALFMSNDPIVWLRQNWSKTKKMDKSWEPKWYDPDNCIRAARLLGIANFSTVFNALSAITITDQVRWTRNAIVHSLPLTYSRFRDFIISIGLSKNISPTEVIYERIGGMGQLYFDYWISEFRLCLLSAIR